MTPKQKVFIDEYLIDFNATRAAIAAGYSKKAAKEIGCENLTKPNIQEAIQKAMKERSERTEITQDMVLKELAKLGFSNIKDYIETGSKDFVCFKNIDDIPEEAARAIEAIKLIKNNQGGSLEFKLHSKTKGLEMIGRHLGMFPNKVDHGGEVVHSLKFDFGENGNGDNPE